MNCSVETRKPEGATPGTEKIKTLTNGGICEKVHKKGDIKGKKNYIKMVTRGVKRPRHV